MKKIIQILVDDHKVISENISDIEKLINLKLENSITELSQKFKFFTEFTFKGHHLREDEILYAWMRSQDSHADNEIMNRIKLEHDKLEDMGKNILKDLNSFLKEEKHASSVSIISDCKDFTILYREHMEKEEKFIFMIAEGLKLSPKEEEDMLKKCIIN